MQRVDNGSFTRLQFLGAVSHSMGAHTNCLPALSVDASDTDSERSRNEER